MHECQENRELAMQVLSDAICHPVNGQFDFGTVIKKLGTCQNFGNIMSHYTCSKSAMHFSADR